MNKRIGIILGALVLLLVGTGVVVYKAVVGTKPEEVAETILDETLPPTDASITVDLTKSKTRENTMVMSISGLASKYKDITYELSYETQGVVQGVTSQPLDITGKDTFVRDDIYLGTCSRNVCRPHTGVSKISVVIIFSDLSGQRSQFSKDYDL